METAPAARRRMTVSWESVPRLARGVKLRLDETRGRWVLLVPERVMAPDDIAVELLQLCDGGKSVTAMVDLLAAKYTAPPERIGADIIEMLQDLADSGFLIDGSKQP
ncbi:MAG: coenzyme synthesis protein [Devosia sp.]|nr:coenzyme synthesis protein [Devosia sp.]